MGSKGLPGKNVKILNGKPLVAYSIDFALDNMKEGDQLCISTNDNQVVEIATKMGVDMPFIRPEELATDYASTQDVILHALYFYESIGVSFDAIMLLQPTSPIRINSDLVEMFSMFNEVTDMVVSVKLSKDNPYFNLFMENEEGLLEKPFKGNFLRRQDCPNFYTYNGSMYLINANSIKNNLMSEFRVIRKLVMPEYRSIDIDIQLDWNIVEQILINSKEI
jgi:N-acylneuraminate cytidylyltransferase